MRTKLKKGLAVLLLTAISNSIFFPSVSYAVSSAFQPEYSSYEPMATTDMVNLVTGDFTFNIPILQVPGPEGGFALPLSYHAGISLDQEASWAGLGWNVNPGAIQRQASQYPDDFNGLEILNTNVSAPGGWGVSLNAILYHITYDSEKGFGGALTLGSLEVGFGSEAGLTVAGVTWNKQGVSVDPVGVALGLIDIATTGIGDGTLLTAALGAEAGAAVGVSLNIGTTFLATTGALQSMASSGTKSVNKSDWTNPPWSYMYFLQGYHYYLNSTKGEYLYGALYLGDIREKGTPSGGPYVTQAGGPKTDINQFYELNTTIAASDMHMYIGDDASSPVNRGYVINPTSISYDQYNVMGDGVSGSIKPYRHDVGTLAFPTRGDANSNRFELVPFLSSATKVHFKYDGDNSNAYTYHKGNTGTITNPVYGIARNNYLDYTLTDNNLFTNNQTEADRDGLKSNHLAQNRFINWFSNTEISSGVAVTAGFIDCKTLAQRTAFRNALPGSGIGGFSITRNDGLTYHYALPVYNKNQLIFSNKTTPVSSCWSKLNNPYAVNWLLTAITGPDFVDRGETGILDDADWGYYVKLEYGKFASNYKWRSPYTNYNFNPAADGSIQYMEGIKETYYLRTISTRSHTAMFVTGERSDGKGHYNSGAYATTLEHIQVADPSSSLKLSEIILLKNEDYNNLISPTGINCVYTGTSNDLAKLKNGDTFSDVWDNYDITTNARTFITANQLKRVLFYYYAPGDVNELCQGTLNSFDLAATTTLKGKLTLKSVYLMGKNDIQVMPPYTFQYMSNTNYSPFYFDGWGMYSSAGANNKDSHAATSDGTQWSLNKIVTPLGGEINITYERDTYNSISGQILGGNKLGGDIRVKQIATTDENGNIYRSQYAYTQDGTFTGISSGVCSMEPDFIKTGTDPYFYNYYDYPLTPVMYGTVTVYNGNLTTATDYLDKTEYKFVTPNSNMITRVTNTILDGSNVAYPTLRYKMYQEKMDINTSQIGAISSIKRYNNKGNKVRETSFAYAAANKFGDLGQFTEGSILSNTVSNNDDGFMYEQIYRTSKIYYPTIPESVTTIENGLTQTKTTLSFDYTTGNILESEYTNSSGDKYKEKSVPAYTLAGYAGMKSKIYSTDNKNMLSQQAASYYYKSIDGVYQLIGANVQTWANAWIYRDNNTSFTDLPVTNDLWRKSASYVWQSPTTADGAINNFAEYFTNGIPTVPASPYWKNSSTVTRYDRYSKPLESYDINGVYSARKTGYNESYVLASITNSNYRSFAYSGFEDKFPTATGTTVHFGGEVRGGQYQSASVIPHTGNFIASVPANTAGPTFDAIKDGLVNGLILGRTYRASVWVHQSSPAAAVLVAKLINTSGATIFTETARRDNVGNKISNKQAGNWILMSVNLVVDQTASNNAIQVYVGNLGTTTAAYFDDLMIHPVDAPMTGYVYEPKTGQVTAILNNENYATTFSYNRIGQLKGTYKETSAGFKKVSETETHYGRP